MKLVDKKAKKEFDSVDKWVEAILKGLQKDLKHCQELKDKAFKNKNLEAYFEGKYVGNFIAWFINNYIEVK
jgi:ferritin